MSDVPARFSPEELGAEGAMMLPAKEVLSLLDLNVDVDLALDLVAPIDLSVAGNLNVGAPIQGAVSANVLSALSTSAAQATQGVMLDQLLTGQAIADAPQSAVVSQTAGVTNGETPPTAGQTPAVPAATTPDAAVPAPAAAADATTGNLLDGDLLNINVDISLDANLAAPIAGAIAVNANAAAPISAAVSANVGSIGSQAAAVADQQAIIHQTMDGVVAHATSAQDAEISQ